MINWRHIRGMFFVLLGSSGIVFLVAMYMAVVYPAIADQRERDFLEQVPEVAAREDFEDGETRFLQTWRTTWGREGRSGYWEIPGKDEINPILLTKLPLHELRTTAKYGMSLEDEARRNRAYLFARRYNLEMAAAFDEPIKTPTYTDPRR